MSALRSRHGLHRVNGAEPQVVGLAPRTTMMIERANTMKTYILRDPNPVERQNLVRRDPAVTATGPKLFIGLDVHNDTIAV